jgi:hypothetical protein
MLASRICEIWQFAITPTNVDGICPIRATHRLLNPIPFFETNKLVRVIDACVMPTACRYDSPSVCFPCDVLLNASPTLSIDSHAFLAGATIAFSKISAFALSADLLALLLPLHKNSSNQIGIAIVFAIKGIAANEDVEPNSSG